MEGEGGLSGLQAEIQKNNHRQLQFADVCSPAVPWPCRSRWSDQVLLFKWLLSSFITCPLAGTLPHFDHLGNIIKEKLDDLWMSHS